MKQLFTRKAPKLSPWVLGALLLSGNVLADDGALRVFTGKGHVEVDPEFGELRITVVGSCFLTDKAAEDAVAKAGAEIWGEIKKLTPVLNDKNKRTQSQVFEANATNPLGKIRDKKTGVLTALKDSCTNKLYTPGDKNAVTAVYSSGQSFSVAVEDMNNLEKYKEVLSARKFKLEQGKLSVDVSTMDKQITEATRLDLVTQGNKLAAEDALGKDSIFCDAVKGPQGISCAFLVGESEQRPLILMETQSGPVSSPPRNMRESADARMDGGFAPAGGAGPVQIRADERGKIPVTVKRYYVVQAFAKDWIGDKKEKKEDAVKKAPKGYVVIQANGVVKGLKPDFAQLSVTLSSACQDTPEDAVGAINAATNFLLPEMRKVKGEKTTETNAIDTTNINGPSAYNPWHQVRVTLPSPTTRKVAGSPEAVVPPKPEEKDLSFYEDSCNPSGAERDEYPTAVTDQKYMASRTLVLKSNQLAEVQKLSAKIKATYAKDSKLSTLVVGRNLNFALTRTNHSAQTRQANLVADAVVDAKTKSSYLNTMKDGPQSIVKATLVTPVPANAGGPSLSFKAKSSKDNQDEVAASVAIPATYEGEAQADLSPVLNGDDPNLVPTITASVSRNYVISIQSGNLVDKVMKK